MFELCCLPLHLSVCSLIPLSISLGVKVSVVVKNVTKLSSLVPLCHKVRQTYFKFYTGDNCRAVLKIQVSPTFSACLISIKHFLYKMNTSLVPLSKDGTMASPSESILSFPHAAVTLIVCACLVCWFVFFIIVCE